MKQESQLVTYAAGPVKNTVVYITVGVGLLSSGLGFKEAQGCSWVVLVLVMQK